MVDSLSPLPPISARIVKTQVTEKKPHHQHPEQHSQHNDKEETEEREQIQDEILISEEQSLAEENKEPKPICPPHNIDIEA